MSLRTLRRAVCASLLCSGISPGLCLADFQYVPQGSQQAGPAPVVTSSTPPAPGPTSVPVHHRHHVTTAATRKPLPEGVPLAPGKGDVIAGFGSQVPLVMALREIVPASYQFAYGQNLGLGRLVDWKGGKPWHDVLNDVLTPLNLAAKESNNVIVIDKAG